MAFFIEFSSNAERQIAALRAYDRARLLDEIGSQLTHQPDQVTRQRKQLTDHPLADWELRVGDWRVFYDVDLQEQQVGSPPLAEKYEADW